MSHHHHHRQSQSTPSDPSNPSSPSQSSDSPFLTGGPPPSSDLVMDTPSVGDPDSAMAAGATLDPNLAQPSPSSPTPNPSITNNNNSPVPPPNNTNPNPTPPPNTNNNNTPQTDTNNTPSQTSTNNTPPQTSTNNTPPQTNTNNPPPSTGNSPNPLPPPDQPPPPTPSPTNSGNNKPAIGHPPPSSSSPNPPAPSPNPSPINQPAPSNILAPIPFNAFGTGAFDPSRTPSVNVNPPNQSSSQPVLPTTSDNPHPSQSAHHNHDTSPSDNGSATNVGTIIGILVAATVASLLLVGFIGILKRRRRAKRDIEFPSDLFDEKPIYDVGVGKKSTSSESYRVPVCPDGNQSVDVRAEGLYAPRPPSIIERHQISPAAIPSPAPSYQPGQIVNFKTQPSFNLHRPKPPVYHDYSTESALAYTNNRVIDPCPRDQNAGAPRGWNSPNGSSFANRYDPSGNTGGLPYSPSVTISGPIEHGKDPSTQSVPPSSGPGYLQATPTYQRQVEQLDFTGQSSPVPTMVGSNLSDWPKSPCQFSTEGSISVATGVALSEERSGTPIHPQSTHNFTPNGDGSAPHPSTALSHDRGADGSNRPVAAHGTDQLQVSADWKLASPPLSSPIGEIFNHPIYGNLVEGVGSSQTEDERKAAQVLKVTNA